MRKVTIKSPKHLGEMWDRRIGSRKVMSIDQFLKILRGLYGDGVAEDALYYIDEVVRTRYCGTKCRYCGHQFGKATIEPNCPTAKQTRALKRWVNDTDEGELPDNLLETISTIVWRKR